MQEVRDLTAVLTDSIAFIRKAHADAKDSLSAEVAKARANVDKINSLTSQFKEANKELEAFIAGTGSNFPPPDDVTGTGEAPVGLMSTPVVSTRADINGVILNPEGKR